MPKIDGRTALKAALLSRGFQRDPRSRDAYKFAHAGGSLPDMRIDFGKKSARLEEKFVGAWRGISETVYYGHVTEAFADKWAMWASAKANGFKGGVEPRVERTEAQKKSLEKSRAKSAAERQRTSGPGYYVTNRKAHSSGRAINHEEPFRTLDAAIELAWKQYREHIARRFDYLLPVQVIQSKSRTDAEYDRGYVWWTDGKRKGPPDDPRQMKLPGIRHMRGSAAYDGGEWPTCLNCGHLTLSDGTCVNRKCMIDRLEEFARHRRGDPDESGARTRIQKIRVTRPTREKVRSVRVGMALPPGAVSMHGSLSAGTALVETDTGWAVVELLSGKISRVLLDNAAYKSAKNVYGSTR